MLRSYTKDITCADGAEERENVVTAQAGKTITIVSMTAELDDDVTLVGYIEQDQLVNAGLGCDAFGRQFIPVDHEMSEGQTFKMGIKNSSGGSVTLQVTTFYREE